MKTWGKATLAAVMLAAPIAALVVTFASGCTSSPSSNCPSDLPGSCPANPPSYKTTVAPIFESRCLQCHGDGGVEVKKFDFSDYPSVSSHQSAILNQVYACSMPPPDAAAPTPQERQALLTWLVCHAPNN